MTIIYDVDIIMPPSAKNLDICPSDGLKLNLLQLKGR